MKQEDFVTSVIYLLALSIEQLLRESERLIRKRNAEQSWKYEKKQMFNQFLDYVKKACVLSDKIYGDIIDAERNSNYKYLDVWGEEANELARFSLMIADRITDIDVVNKIHDFIMEQPGDGLCDEELLSRFYLK